MPPAGLKDVIACTGKPLTGWRLAVPLYEQLGLQRPGANRLFGSTELRRRRAHCFAGCQQVGHEFDFVLRPGLTAAFHDP